MAVIARYEMGPYGTIRSKALPNPITHSCSRDMNWRDIRHAIRKVRDDFFVCSVCARGPRLYRGTAAEEVYGKEIERSLSAIWSTALVGRPVPMSGIRCFCMSASSSNP